MSPRSLFLIMVCILPTLAVADDLVIPVGHQGADKASLERPLKGIASATVEQKFGAPLSKSSPVGNPPISSWEYPEYRVYFEADRVLHTVLKPMSSEPMPTEPAPVAAPATEIPEVPAAAAPSIPAAELPTTPAEVPTPEAPAEVE